MNPIRLLVAPARGLRFLRGWLAKIQDVAPQQKRMSWASTHKSADRDVSMTSMTLNGQSPIQSSPVMELVRSMTAAFAKWSERNSNNSALDGMSASRLNDIGLDAANDDLPAPVRAVWAA